MVFYLLHFLVLVFLFVCLNLNFSLSLPFSTCQWSWKQVKLAQNSNLLFLCNELATNICRLICTGYKTNWFQSFKAWPEERKRGKSCKLSRLKVKHLSKFWPKSNIHFSDSSAWWTTCWQRRVREGGQVTAAEGCLALWWKRSSLKIHRLPTRQKDKKRQNDKKTSTPVEEIIPEDAQVAYNVKCLPMWLICGCWTHNVQVPVCTEKRSSLTNGNHKMRSRPNTPGTSRNESQLFAVNQVIGLERFYTWHPHCPCETQTARFDTYTRRYNSC